VTADIFFKSPEHKQRFLAVMQTYGHVYDGKLDQEYGAALYILTADLDTWQQTSSYVYHDGIDFEGMFKEVDFSGGYTRLVKLAGNLFNSGQHIEPIDFCAAQLDDDNFQVALAALQLRRNALHVSKPELYQADIDERNRISRENREKPWLPQYDGE